MDNSNTLQQDEPAVELDMMTIAPPPDASSDVATVEQLDTTGDVPTVEQPPIAAPIPRATCADCGSTADDVMRRSVATRFGEPLCTMCCSRYPGRAWMVHKSETDEHA